MRGNPAHASAGTAHRGAARGRNNAPRPRARRLRSIKSNTRGGRALVVSNLPPRALTRGRSTRPKMRHTRSLRKSERRRRFSITAKILELPFVISAERKAPPKRGKSIALGYVPWGHARCRLAPPTTIVYLTARAARPQERKSPAEAGQVRMQNERRVERDSRNQPIAADRQRHDHGINKRP